LPGLILVVRRYRVSQHEGLSCCYLINIPFCMYITLQFRQCSACLHHSVPIKVAEDLVIKEPLDK